MQSKGAKAEMLATHFQSNGCKASVGGLICFIERDKSFSSLERRS
jgi:hypothetical protein